jgi:hypothetical protein
MGSDFLLQKTAQGLAKDLVFFKEELNSHLRPLSTELYFLASYIEKSGKILNAFFPVWA